MKLSSAVAAAAAVGWRTCISAHRSDRIRRPAWAGYCSWCCKNHRYNPLGNAGPLSPRS